MLIEPVEMDAIGTDGVALAEAHDRTLAELLLNLADGNVDGFGAFFQVVEGGMRAPLVARPGAGRAWAGQAVRTRW